MDKFLYHMVPSGMIGNVLYPLNALKEMYPELYNSYIEKYKGREILTEYKIECLKCLWNDVIFLTAIHPQKIKDALLESGYNPKRNKWYKIPLDSLNISKLAITDGKDLSDSKKCILYNGASDFEQLQRFPDETKEYYQQCSLENRRPLLFAYSPQFLYKGEIDVTHYEIITV